ncbi:MAG: hypothetical protein IJX27_09655 [Clostridia bacterium]|nr:hypothetical protein [Clostridia bacterium]
MKRPNVNKLKFNQKETPSLNNARKTAGILSPRFYFAKGRGRKNMKKFKKAIDKSEVI